MWRYRKCSCKIVILSLFCQFSSFFKTKSETFSTSCSTLRFIFQSFYIFNEIIVLIIFKNQVYRIFKRHIFYNFFLFPQSVFIFFLRENIRVVVNYCYFKIFRQIFQHICATRATTAMKQKCWNCAF